MKTSVMACAVVAALAVAVQPASAESITLRANLQGGGEATTGPSPTAGVLTGAVGAAVVIVDRDSLTLSVTLQLFNIPTGTTAGHIHAGSAGVAGPVILNFPIPAGRTGDFTLEFRLDRTALVPRPEIGINTIQDALQTVVGGGSYANIHTMQFPGGEIRGQLIADQ